MIGLEALCGVRIGRKNELGAEGGPELNYRSLSFMEDGFYFLFLLSFANESISHGKVLFIRRRRRRRRRENIEHVAPTRTRDLGPGVGRRARRNNARILLRHARSFALAT